MTTKIVDYIMQHWFHSICVVLVLISTFSNQLASIEAARLEWVRSLPVHSTNAFGWVYSGGLIALAYGSAFGLYALVLRMRFQHDYSIVVTNDYHAATYKLLPEEEYKKIPEYIPQNVKDAVLGRDGLKCRITGKKVYKEPPGRFRNWVWHKTKGSKKVLPAIVSILAERQMFDYGHIIPRRLGGLPEVDNVIIESRSHNRGSNRYLYGKKKRLALVKLKEWNETIHKDAL